MTPFARLPVLGLVLLAVGCHTCGDRPRLFPRLREAFDRDDYTHRNHDTDADRLAAAPRATGAAPAAAGCLPCSGVGGVPTGSTLGFNGNVMGYPGGSYGSPTLGPPVMTGGSGMPVYPGGSGVVIPGGTYAPRDNELPPPGGYSQPRPEDMGRTVPRPPATFTGGGR